MKVLITTSDIGSELEPLTKHTNKSLIRIGRKPVLSYIIDLYPKDTEFIITIGHKADHVRDFIDLVYKKHKIRLIYIDGYEGLGSSIGHSMIKVQKYLQSPFIFHACDTVVENIVIPPLNHNWTLGSKINNSNQYRSFNILNDGTISHFNDRGVSGHLGHVGIVGIKDYDHYWKNLKDIYKKKTKNQLLDDVMVLSSMISSGISFKGYEIDVCYNVSNPKSLELARSKISDKFNNLDKTDESLFLFDDFVVKFFSDEKKIFDRIRRGKILGKLVPKTIEIKKNFYKYKYIDGKTYSDVADDSNFESFLIWSKKNLWRKVNIVPDNKFRDICKDFYLIKTKERIKKMHKVHKIKDQANIINNIKIPPIKDLLNMVDFKRLSNGLQTRFHGDYILENILKTKDGYCLLDWRQDFGGIVEAGDMYYDLAKLAHNLVINHNAVSKNLFEISFSGKNIFCDIMRKNNLVDCERILNRFIQKNGFDRQKVNILRAIIWLNMSPLHHDPFNLFLYYFGKLNLWKAINEKNEKQF